MALSAADAILPLGTLAPDLVPRTADEVKAFAEDPDGEGVYATDTAKTTAYVTAFLSAAYADARVSELEEDAQDTAARYYASWRAWSARADVGTLTPQEGSADSEGSYKFTAAQIATAQANADRFESAFLAALPSVVPVSTRRRSRSVTKTVIW